VSSKPTSPELPTLGKARPRTPPSTKSFTLSSTTLAVELRKLLFVDIVVVVVFVVIDVVIVNFIVVAFVDIVFDKEFYFVLNNACGGTA
jgi:hypothetical protein